MADVIMPQMGESIAEGTVTKWIKNVGDRVERDEPLFEISTDKVDAEIPSPAAGVLTEIRVAPGTTVADPHRGGGDRGRGRGRRPGAPGPSAPPRRPPQPSAPRPRAVRTRCGARRPGPCACCAPARAGAGRLVPDRG